MSEQSQANGLGSPEPRGVALPTPIENPVHQVRIFGSSVHDTVITVDGVEQKDVIRYEIAAAAADQYPVLALYRVVPRSYEIDQAMEIVEKLADEARRNNYAAVVNSFGINDEEAGFSLLRGVIEDAARYRAMRAMFEARTNRVAREVLDVDRWIYLPDGISFGRDLDKRADGMRETLKRAGCWPLTPGGDKYEPEEEDNGPDPLMPCDGDSHIWLTFGGAPKLGTPCKCGRKVWNPEGVDMAEFLGADTVAPADPEIPAPDSERADSDAPLAAEDSGPVG